MTEENQSSAVRKHNNKWRVVDIVVAAIIAVASGVIFWAWDFIYAVPTALFDSLTPGLGGLFHFMWLFAGPLVAIIIRKPGAAFFGETIAAVIETLLGNPFGVAHALLIGMAQGLGAEIGFAVFAYRKWNLLTVTLAGALTGLSNGLYEWVVRRLVDTARRCVHRLLRHLRCRIRRSAHVVRTEGARQNRCARPLRIRSYAGTGLIVRCKQIPHHIKVVRDFLVMAHRMTTAYETTA